MNNKHYKYILLERYLNRFKFLDIPLGGVVADQYIMVGINGVPGGKKILMNLLIDFFYLTKSVLKKTNRISFNKVILTRISDKPHIKNIILPLINNFMPDVTVIENPGVSKNNLDYQAISVKETFNTPIKFLLSIFLCIYDLLFHLIKNRRKLQLTPKETIYYLICIFHQLKILAFYDYQFKNNFSVPKVVVVEFDRNSIVSPLILAANKHKIPTITLVHGVINNYGFAPVLADKVFCFGEIQKQQLLRQGVPARQIVITGTSIVDFNPDSGINERKAHSPFVLCLGISPFGKDKINYFIEECVKAITKRDDAKLLIKLHPSHKIEDFKHYEAENIHVLSSTSIKNADLFCDIDLLIVHNSGLGVEAAMAGVPVAVFDIPGLDLGMGKIMVEEGGFKLLKNHTEINTYVNLLGITDNFSIEIKRSIGFANKFYYSTGTRASKIIVEKIWKIIINNI